MNCMENIDPVVSIATAIANSNRHIFKHDESILVFERLALDGAGLNGAFAILAFVFLHATSFQTHLRCKQ
jgi:hypothetical protein